MSIFSRKKADLENDLKDTVNDTAEKTETEISDLEDRIEDIAENVAQAVDSAEFDDADDDESMNIPDSLEKKERSNTVRDFIVFENVKKIYKMGEVEIEALAGVDFSIDKGEFVIIAGASGAGKSTILNILGGMDSLSSGKITVDGAEISKYSSKELITYRRYDVGFVFQFYNLVQNLTAVENVELATQICKDPLDAVTVIEQVGLADRKSNFPSQLSGGEQQRVAIARALAKNPKLLLCDEPTGALDYKTGKAILKLLQDTCREHGMTVIVITHNLAIAPMGDKVIKVKSGKIDSITINDNPVDIERIEW